MQRFALKNERLGHIVLAGAFVARWKDNAANYPNYPQLPSITPKDDPQLPLNCLKIMRTFGRESASGGLAPGGGEARTRIGRKRGLRKSTDEPSQV